MHRGQFKDRMAQAGADGKPLGCEACHSTKTWKDLTKFDHARTSFPLVGSHRAIACIDCHKPPNMGTKLTEVDFKGAPTGCEECHQDVHGDKRTAFALQGVHRNVRCDGCHKLMKPVEGKMVLFYKPTPKECAACHGPEELKGRKTM